ncbi:fimbrial protein [Pantoea sp. C2G6]|uniref:fimbrial protein n=1 Tax=Pantoea sp. C2G6 TaxID=3243084 RepID=UPI003ED9D886
MPAKYSTEKPGVSGVRAFLKNSFTLLGCMVIYPLCAQGAITIDPVPITISGTVIATASCTFGSDKTIEIEFGDVYISQIIGDTYKKPVDYTLSCEGDADGKTVYMEWVGDQSSFDSTLLTTDVTGLGVKLLQNNTQVSPNTRFTIDAASPPSLDVVLVKNSGASFTNGQEFNASATLKVDYQ